MKTQPTSLYPFVPSGPDFRGALRFFHALGFGTQWEAGVCWHVRKKAS